MAGYIRNSDWLPEFGPDVRVSAQEPGRVGQARGLLEALEVGCFWS